MSLFIKGKEKGELALTYPSHLAPMPVLSISYLDEIVSRYGAVFSSIIVKLSELGLQ